MIAMIVNTLASGNNDLKCTIIGVKRDGYPVDSYSKWCGCCYFEPDVRSEI